MTYDQVRLRMRALVDPMCGQIEETADAIIAGSTNRAVQQAALRWKIEAVPALREALFQPDPLSAVMDTYALCIQMADYFEKGRGAELLGEASIQAATTCRRLEEDLARIAAEGSISGDVSKARAGIKKWAAEHPIRYSIAARESTLSRALEQEIRDSLSLGDAVVGITTTLDDMNRRLEIYSDQLLRQVRWEKDLFKSELLEDLPVERTVKLAELAVATVTRAATTAERALSAAENAPSLVASEGEAAMKALRDEIARTGKFLQNERSAVLEYLTRERIAALFELHESIAEERKAMTGDFEQFALKTVDYALARLQRLMLLALALILVVSLVGLFLVRVLFFRGS